MDQKSEPQVIDATLYVAPGCPHCPTVLNGLSELVKTGRIGQLTVINIASRPELAAEHGVRSPITPIRACAATRVITVA